MVRFGGMTVDGRRLIGIGLSDANIRELQKDHPIFVDGRTVLAPGVEVFILWGETEQVIVTKIQTSGVMAVQREIQRDELPPQPPLTVTPMMFREAVRAWVQDQCLVYEGAPESAVTDDDCDALYERLTGKRPAW